MLLAQDQPAAALQRLEPALQRTMAGQRLGHVLEICLLQALAHQRLDEEAQALAALSEAVHLGEPEGYLRTFVDKGTPMEVLLYRLRKRCAKQGPTPYLDTLLTAFQQESKAHLPAETSTKSQLLPELLSERERQVLQLLAQSRSNREIAQELVIALDTANVMSAISSPNWASRTACKPSNRRESLASSTSSSDVLVCPARARPSYKVACYGRIAKK